MPDKAGPRAERAEMTYFGELFSNWNRLLGTCIALGTGAAISFFTTALFGPALIADLGWSRAGFALVGFVPMVSVFTLPFVGRFADRVGPRVAGTFGFTVLTLCFLAFANMRGSLWEFLTITAVLGVFGVMTSSLVFGRVIVDRFDKARGLALSVMMSASPLSGAIVAPFIGKIIADHGWRSGYYALAAISAAGGILALSLIGRSDFAKAKERPPLRISKAEFLTIARNPVFPLMMIGMLLVNVPQTFASAQLKLVALDKGVSDTYATWLVSLYPLGSIAGRFLCGIGLDRMQSHIVALITLGIPALSFAVFAAGAPAMWLLVPAVLFIGLAQGAEGDVGAYIISRRFDPQNFSLLYAFMNMMVSAGTGIGAAFLSATLHQGFDYQPYIIVCAITALVGALLFGLTGLAGKRTAATATKSEPI
jgi:MFS family permease